MHNHATIRDFNLTAMQDSDLQAAQHHADAALLQTAPVRQQASQITRQLNNLYNRKNTDWDAYHQYNALEQKHATAIADANPPRKVDRPDHERFPPNNAEWHRK